MPEIRHDALTGDAVLLATARADRPAAFGRTGRADGSGVTGDERDPECPFCPGNEDRTPPEVLRSPAGSAVDGWSVRVFPNLFPLVESADASVGRVTADSVGGSTVTGMHEVLVLSPSHRRSFGLLDDDQAAEALLAARTRAAQLPADGASHVQVLVNHGREAGASLPHPHMQIVALDHVPEGVEADMERFAAGADSAEGADPVVEACEQAGGPRGVLHGDIDGVDVWCPYASVVPYQVRLALRAAGPSFATADDDEVRAASHGLRDALARLGRLLGDPPYNVVLRTAPTDTTRFHWFVDVLPRLTVQAGFEMATGLAVNIVDPDTAAQELRSV
ncbi:MAG: hypothetical protein R3A49_08175 [Acidimicrobiia bacterium]